MSAHPEMTPIAVAAGQPVFGQVPR
jgi:hypothetical protein